MVFGPIVLVPHGIRAHGLHVLKHLKGLEMLHSNLCVSIEEFSWYKESEHWCPRFFYHVPL